MRPPARFGEIKIKKNSGSFKEKPQVTDGWINGGFVAKTKFLKLIKNDLQYLKKSL